MRLLESLRIGPLWHYDEPRDERAVAGGAPARAAKPAGKLRAQRFERPNPRGIRLSAHRGQSGSARRCGASGLVGRRAPSRAPGPGEDPPVARWPQCEDRVRARARLYAHPGLRVVRPERPRRRLRLVLAVHRPHAHGRARTSSCPSSSATSATRRAARTTASPSSCPSPTGRFAFQQRAGADTLMRYLRVVGRRRALRAASRSASFRRRR